MKALCISILSKPISITIILKGFSLFIIIIHLIIFMYMECGWKKILKYSSISIVILFIKTTLDFSLKIQLLVVSHLLTLKGIYNNYL